MVGPVRNRTDRFGAGLYLLTPRNGNLYICRLTEVQAAILKRMVNTRFIPPCGLEVLELDDRSIRNLRNLLENIDFDRIILLNP